MGMRSRAPPVADAARRSTRSGRKNRASEQREDFFGHRKADGADAPAATLERICAQYGRCFASFVSSTASDRKGFVKGESVPLDRVLPTFARTKVGPRRAGVQIKTFYKTMRRRQATTNPPHRSGIPFMPHQRLPQPLGRGSPFLSLIYTARALHRWCAGYGAPGGCPARPNTPRTAPSPRGSRGSCGWPSRHPRRTGLRRAGSPRRRRSASAASCA